LQFPSFSHLFFHSDPCQNYPLSAILCFSVSVYISHKFRHWNILCITLRGFWFYWFWHKRWAVRKQLGLSSVCMLGDECGNRNGFYKRLSQQEWPINQIEFEAARDITITVTVMGTLHYFR
jgi:hypothetical protein